MPALTDIESKIFSSKDFRLENGQILPVLELAYETYGTLNAKRDNAVLAVHGYTSSHHAAGKNAAGKQGRGVPEGAAGWFDGLIGPGKAVDTDKYFVISVNALGSAHGSSGPNTIDPRTRQALRPDLPADHDARHGGEPEAAGRFVRRARPRRGDRPVDGRLPVVPVGRVLSRIHERHRRVGDGAARARRAGRPRGAAEAAGERSQLERRLVLREWRHQDGAGRDPLRHAQQLRPERDPGRDDRRSEKRKEAMRANARRGPRSTTAIRWSRCAARSALRHHRRIRQAQGHQGALRQFQDRQAVRHRATARPT